MNSLTINRWPKIGQLYRITEIFTCFYKTMITFEEMMAGNTDIMPKLFVGDIILVLENKTFEQKAATSYRKTEVFYFLYNGKIMWTHLRYFNSLEEVIQNE